MREGRSEYFGGGLLCYSIVVRRFRFVFYIVDFYLLRFFIYIRERYLASFVYVTVVVRSFGIYVRIVLFF